MSSTTDNSSTAMTPYFHFAGGDSLFFKTITPSSKGALAGAAIFLFFLALLERFVVSYRAYLEVTWNEKGRECAAARDAQLKEKSKSSDGSLSVLSSTAKRTIPPFIPKHDVTRGVIHGLEALLHFALMLAIMTFQAAYFIAVVAGLAVGEVVFGHLLGSAHAHAH